MLQLPDFKEKQVLIIAPMLGEKYSIKFWNDNIRLFIDGKSVNQLSCYKIFCIFIIGDLTVTTQVIKKAMEYGISIFFLKRNFELYGHIGAQADGNYLARMKQYSLTEEQELSYAKHIVKNKIWNQLLLLNKVGKIKSPVKERKVWDSKIEALTNHKQLLGTEGTSSKVYFQQYFQELNWFRRMPQTKVDHLNTLMDIGYTLLFHFVDSIIRLYGLDSYKGFYHKLFFQRKSLACDLMEPFRCIIDRAIIKGHNLGQMSKEDFQTRKSEVILPYDKQSTYIKLFLEEIMDNKEEIFTYVRDFYYCIINDTKDFPLFSIYK